MNYYTKLRLDELGISSDEEAEELEYELELRFEDFTPKNRRTWLQQNDCLEHYSRTGTLTSAARKAGATVFTAQRWTYDNALGFTRRFEVADLIFKDRLKEKALLRASDPKAPATLLIELLRAYIPEEFSRDGHKCDSSTSDELLRRYRENARQELEAGLPELRKLAEGAENAYPPDDGPMEPDVYEGEAVTPDEEPTNSHLSPSGDSSHPAPYGHEPSNATRHTGGGRYPENIPSPSYEPDQDIHTPPSPHNPSAPERRVPPTRAERREQLRQQRKAKKKNTFPVKRF